MNDSRLNREDLSQILRFTLPVAAENLISQLIGMVVSMLIGGITKSALAAVGLVNQTVSMYAALFSLMSNPFHAGAHHVRRQSKAVRHTAALSGRLYPYLS